MLDMTSFRKMSKDWMGRSVKRGRDNGDTYLWVCWTLENTYKSVLFKLDGCPNFASRFENTVAEAGCSVFGTEWVRSQENADEGYLTAGRGRIA